MEAKKNVKNPAQVAITHSAQNSATLEKSCVRIFFSKESLHMNVFSGLLLGQ